MDSTLISGELKSQLPCIESNSLEFYTDLLTEINKDYPFENFLLKTDTEHQDNTTLKVNFSFDGPYPLSEYLMDLNIKYTEDIDRIIRNLFLNQITILFQY